MLNHISKCVCLRSNLNHEKRLRKTILHVYMEMLLKMTNGATSRSTAINEKIHSQSWIQRVSFDDQTLAYVTNILLQTPAVHRPFLASIHMFRFIITSAYARCAPNGHTHGWRTQSKPSEVGLSLTEQRLQSILRHDRPEFEEHLWCRGSGNQLLSSVCWARRALSISLRRFSTTSASYLSLHLKTPHMVPDKAPQETTNV